MLITIHNLHKEQPENHDTDFICDRRSPVGNPFFIGKDGDRDEVCDRYEKYVRVTTRQDFHSFIDSLVIVLEKYKTLRLFCWCMPERCHLETIKILVEERVSERDNVLP